MKKTMCFLISLLAVCSMGNAQSLQCTSDTRVDITFVVDASSSIGNDDYNSLLKPALQGIIDKTIPGDANTPSNIRVAVIVYSTTSVLQWNLDEYQTKNQLMTAVAALPYYGDKRATGDALHDALTLVHPTLRPGVKHLVVLIIDGDSNTGTYNDAEESQKLQDAGARVFAVSVGRTITTSIMDKIISGPHCRNFILSYNDLLQKTSFVSTSLCNEAELLQQCPLDSKVDITFILDTAHPIGASNSKVMQLRFCVRFLMNDLIPGYFNTPSNIRVALIEYGNTSMLQWNLDKYQTKNQIMAALASPPTFESGNERATGDALHDALTLVHPIVRPGAKHLVILITDGISSMGSSLDTEEAAKLRDAGADLYILGIGDAVNNGILDEMASGPEYRANRLSLSDMLVRRTLWATSICKQTAMTSLQPNNAPKDPATTQEGSQSP